MAGKFIAARRSTTIAESSTSLALDAGLLYRAPFLPGLRLGLTVTNFGPALGYSQLDIIEPLPLTLRMGASLDAFALIPALQIPEDSPWRTHLYLNADLERELTDPSSAENLFWSRRAIYEFWRDGHPATYGGGVNTYVGTEAQVGWRDLHGNLLRAALRWGGRYPELLHSANYPEAWGFSVGIRVNQDTLPLQLQFDLADVQSVEIVTGERYSYTFTLSAGGN
ncbi:MAG: hypothetical protein C4524_08060 [Candidatus Zixiibacteriota bacterium]|nr:MAG: hypothetical protein C4524_08060 [candidate division Zixibacteria bacterium]